MLPSYAELHCLSNFSFLRGASHPEEMVARAAVLGYSALALTDECSVAGVVRAHLAAKECGIKLIVGTEIRLEDGPELVLLATDREGYGNLSELISLGRRRAAKGAYALTRADLEGGLPGCLALLVPEESRAGDVGLEPDLQLPAQARWLASRFPGSAWIAVELLRGADDLGRLESQRALSAETGLPLVAAGGVRMHVRGRKRLHDVLTAIRVGRPVARCGFDLLPNGERHLRSLGRLSAIYPPELMMETLAVTERCQFSLEELRYEYPKEVVPEGETPSSHLKALTLAGLARRYPRGVPPSVSELVDKELALIRDLAYEPFFLTVHDVVVFARSRGILCQGRGSAANSAVCYALGITEVDPARASLLFERFISKERNEPPDIDVDFEHQRREEVMQYLYAKYGRERAALAAALITWRPKSALRDVGKALGLSLDQVDRLAKSVSWWDGRTIRPERLLEAGFEPDNPTIKLLTELAGELLGFPRHLSQHVGGFVIARDKLTRLVPVENAAMPGRTVIQWDKDDLDALGLLKVDVLALGMLTAIRRCLDLVNGWRNSRLTLSDIPSEDPAVYDMIGKGDTVGVFQIESRAQMAMLPRLKPRNFYDLVIEVAIVRPGPIQGGMVHPYLRRRQGLEPVDYPSPAVKKVLERTLGVPIFQEQVMQIAMVAAGFTAGEADQLRRSMAAWKKKGGLDKFHGRLLSGMLARGYRSEFAERIFQQIQGFGEYGFPESHAASFALLVYVSAWLKCHEPAAFACALLNSLPMGFYSPSQILQDARRHGVAVLPVDVAVSGWECALESGEVESGPWEVGKATARPRHGSRAPSTPAVIFYSTHYPLPTSHSPVLRLGLNRVKGLSREGAIRIEEARRQAPFSDVGDLARRSELDSRDLDALAAADALASLAGHRREALWQTLGVDAGLSRQAPLLAQAHFSERQPDLFAPTEGEDVVADYGSLGLTLRSHPLALLRGKLSALNLCTAAEVGAARPGQVVRAAGIVTCRQRPGTASGVTFLTLEDETGQINVVIWKRLGERYRRELLTARLLAVYGQVERSGQESEVVHLIAGRLVDRTELLGRLVTESRDFQ
ncbi:MAG: error-prone DNA polymerase [Rhodocyclaceae bacterium]|nr:error-prone DNA polymerase [Rhodocyclaceae bacterium]